MSEFLNPKSMITPGIAGAVMMFLVNGLSVPFPELPQRWLALGLSLLIGALVVLKQTDIKPFARLGYWLLNSLVIFTVGFGSNNLAREATSPAPAGLAAGNGGAQPHAALSLLVSSAHAQEPPAPAKAEKKEARAGSDQERKLQARLEALEAENARLQAQVKKGEESAPRRQEGFFKKW